MSRKFRLFLFPSPILPLILAVSCCSNPGCENEVREQLVSPDGVNKVVIFSRNCGATTDFNCQASILPVSKPLPNDVGNAFIFDKGEAKVVWRDSKTLSVSADSSARSFKREEVLQGVELKYSIVADEPASGKVQAIGESG
ncbi:hypothetical protein [Luteolibacter soli]|uniref:Uncharacterized protein n=1 Tax=Luteolibacter soli TaxID=3135280 RepID=A0ABU9ARI7_9BACT